MKLTQLKLRNFTVFGSADFSFASGINVLIGENATGKSHALKVMYSMLKSAGDTRRLAPEEHLKGVLASNFRPDDNAIQRLLRTGSEDACSLWVKADGNETHASFNQYGDLRLTVHQWSTLPNVVYIPARDVLAMYDGFAALYERAEISFDATYYDICIALQSPNQRGEAKVAADHLVTPLNELLGGSVALRGPRFYVNAGDGEHEAHLTAEGLRKIATLIHLVNNGSIKAGTVLFWDEPETNLNPRLVDRLTHGLRLLASRGVQIFIATHDFLLTHRLSLASEHHIEPAVETKFFSLHRESAVEPVEIEVAGTVQQLDRNPILEAYSQYYEYQRELLRLELEQEVQRGGQ